MADAADLYLDLIASILTRMVVEDNDIIAGVPTDWRKRPFGIRLADRVAPLLAKGGYQIVRKMPFDRHAREFGTDVPARAETMVGMKRLANVRECVEAVLRDGVPGDLIETGAWRGGVCIFMRAILRAYGDDKRSVWLADSFAGLPDPDETHYPKDAEMRHAGFFSAKEEEVVHAFERYGLLDDRVRILRGWFKESLPTAPIGCLAVLRLDGDLYESTYQALSSLYPKLAPGGYCIVDDFGAFEACRSAVQDYRREFGIAERIVDIDGSGVYWRAAS